jgi:hypothetical protein
MGWGATADKHKKVATPRRKDREQTPQPKPTNLLPIEKDSPLAPKN